MFYWIDELIAKIPSRYNGLIRKGLLIAAGIFAYFALWESLGTSKTDTKTETKGWWIFKEETQKTVKVPEEVWKNAQRWMTVWIILVIICLILIVWITINENRYKRYLARFKGEEFVSIKSLGRTFNKTEKWIVHNVGNMIDSDLLKDWYIDYDQLIVFNRSFYPEKIKKKIVECPNCGAVNVAIKGLIKNCDYCGTPLSAITQPQAQNLTKSPGATNGTTLG